MLSSERGAPNVAHVEALCADFASVVSSGKQLLLVSSGAIGMGLDALDITVRPERLDLLQMAAAVGQVRLITLYQKFFADHGYTVAQVLLTKEGLASTQGAANARATMEALLARNIIPIVNENDVVATEEIQFSDNDLLSAEVAALLEVDLTVLLTTVDGLLDSKNANQRIPLVSTVDSSLYALDTGEKNINSRGGISSKIKAAEICAASDCSLVVASGSEPRVLERLLANEDVGTLFKLF
ncbi:UNVERIFIED_CONTAM: hypothetical protein GTU68_001078 [Idotea baltica]|nr:hypothetical protein [Idotea baltica]